MSRSGGRPLGIPPSSVLALTHLMVFCRSTAIGALIAWALLWPPEAAAIPPGTAVTQLVVDSWTTLDGLPQDRVQSIAQTKDGLLWAGTESGLARFDGHQFAVFAPPSLPALRDESITALFGARDGSLWIGTRTGLVVHVVGERTVSLAEADGTRPRFIWDFQEDPEGRMWIGAGSGLYRVDGDRLVAVSKDVGPVYGLARSPDGRWWLGGREGVFTWDGHSLRPITEQDGFVWSHPMNLRLGPDDTVWVPLRSSGVARRKDGRWRRFGSDASTIGNLARAVLIDRDGQTWIGTWNGLARLEGESYSPWLSAAGRMPTAIDVLFEDREGAIWVGTMGGGLFRIRQGAIVTHTIEQGLVRDDILAVCTDRSGRLWAGVGDVGANVRTKQGWAIPEETRALVWDRGPLWSCATDTAGAMWLGTGVGLFRDHDGRVERVPLPNVEPESIIDSVMAAKNGDVWVTASSGLFVIPRGKDRAVRIPWTEGLDTVLGEGRDGTIWVSGTQGLYAWRGGVLMPAWHAPDASHRPVSMLADPDGTLWVGTVAAGLLRFRDGKAVVFGRAAGLRDLCVATVLDDGHGYIWLGTHSGLMRVSRQRLSEGNATTRLDPVVYTLRDGLRSDYVDERGQPAGVVTNDGHLWIGTTRGLAEIDPSRLPSGARATGVVVDEVSVDGRRLRPGEVAAPGRGSVQVRFSASARVSSDHLRFRYRLEGFDPGWTESNDSRVATYTNVPPGQYRFVVNAADETPDWGVDSAVVVLGLAPHWYQTWLARGVAVAGFIVVIAAAPLLRARRLRRAAEALSRVVDERTADLRAEVDERRRAEQNLRESEGRYRTLASELEVRVDDRTRALQAEVEEHRRTEARLVVALDAAESAGRAKSAFLASMSHELRTPLNAVIGYTELLQEEAVDQGLTSFESDLTKIRTAGRHLLALVTDVLDVTRIEAGSIVLQPTEFPPRGIISEVVDAISKAARDGGNTVRVDAPTDLRSMTTDAVRLKQVLLNLLSNACKFTKNGTITLAVTQTTGPDGEWTTFVVSDTGIGIAKDDLPRLFIEFSQIRVTGQPAEGAGLGLAISRRLCLLMGGTVDVASEAGKGSAFTLRLPTTLPTAQPPIRSGS